jgi:hypothetical protein
MTWYNNRKFVSPILASIASIIIVIALELIPDFDVPVEVVTGFLGFIWFAAVAILVGDVGYDWIGEFVKALRPAVDHAARRDWIADSTIDENALALLKQLLDEAVRSKSGGEDALA